MDVGKLTVNARSTTGKGPARQLRAAGNVPGVCYGASADGKVAPFPIVVNVKALKASLDPVRKQNTVLDVTVVEDGKAERKLTALLKDYQVDPIRRDVTHVDLMVIDPNQAVTAEVPLDFVGKPKGAIDGGQIRIALRALTLRAKPSDLPTKITVDVGPLDIADVFHVSDLQLPAGVTSLTGQHLAVVTCAAPEEEKATAAEAAPAEGAAPAAAAAPAAGAKPAAGAAPAKAGAAPAKAAAAPAKAPAKK